MSSRSENKSSLSLYGTEGELISIRISIEPRLLEELLEALAEVDFPVNPQIYHAAGPRSDTLVEFPAYASRLDEVRLVLLRRGFDTQALHVTSMLEEIAAARY
jgi:hypothetical protein